MEKPVFLAPDIHSVIRTFRGFKVIFDSDLAAIYGVPTFRFNEAVRRNIEKLPGDFLFQLTKQEYQTLTSQFAISKTGRGGRRTLPWAFTEHGAFVILTPWQRVEVFNSFRQLERTGSLPKRPAIDFILALEKEIRLGYWPHVEFSWTDTVRTANELSAVQSRDRPIRAMDLFHIAIACKTSADEFLIFDEDQANLARAAGLPVWKGKNAQHA
jgi:predicted nucleic acid-binding protein